MLQLRAFSVRFVELVCLPAHHWMWVISWACGEVCIFWSGVCVCVWGVVFLKENFQEPVICFSETIKSSLYFDNSCVCVMEAIQE